MKIAEVDCTTSSALCGRLGVNSYPNIKLFKDGKKEEDYSAGRQLNRFVIFDFLREVTSKDYLVRPDVLKLVFSFDPS